MTGARALPFRTAILCPAACCRAWRGVNGLYPSSYECYHHDENDENAKRNQFSCKHTYLLRTQTCASTTQTVVSLNGRD
jgi:hypothetical protein